MEKSLRSVVFIRKVCFFEDFLGGPVNFIYLFWPCHAAWGVLEFPRLGMEPCIGFPPALGMQSLNHWTPPREVPLPHSWMGKLRCRSDFA